MLQGYEYQLLKWDEAKIEMPPHLWSSAVCHFVCILLQVDCKKYFLSWIHEDFIEIISNFLVLKHLVFPKILELLLSNTGNKDDTGLVVSYCNFYHCCCIFCSLIFSLIYIMLCFMFIYFLHIVITILTVCQWDNFILVPCNLSCICGSHTSKTWKQLVLFYVLQIIGTNCVLKMSPR